MGNLCRLSVHIDTGRLHGGNNLGSIVLKSSYDTVKVPVAVKRQRHTNDYRQRREKKEITLQLMQLYLDFRMKKIGAGSWAKESSRLTEELLSLNDGDLYARLFHAQLLITAQRINEVKWILDHVSESLAQSAVEDDVLWAYYLYLTSLISEEESYVNKVRTRWKSCTGKIRTNGGLPGCFYTFPKNTIKAIPRDGCFWRNSWRGAAAAP